jgi:hypothetical protein
MAGKHKKGTGGILSDEDRRLFQEEIDRIKQAHDGVHEVKPCDVPYLFFGKSLSPYSSESDVLRSQTRKPRQPRTSSHQPRSQPSAVVGAGTRAPTKRTKGATSRRKRSGR